MKLEILSCDECGTESDDLTKCNVITGKRGRPPVKFLCPDCLASAEGIRVVGDSPEPAREHASREPREPATNRPRPKVAHSTPNRSWDFLLGLSFENLFEPCGPRHDWDFRCKGCGERVKRPERREHFQSHKKQLVVA